VLTPVAAPREATAASRPPNVLLIIADDQTYGTLDVMPSVQLMQAHGTTYTNYYDSFPLCCPARATMLSGQYAHNNGVWDNVAPRGGYSALRHKNNTLPRWLHDAGYRTAILGKLMNQFSMSSDGIPAGWDLFRGTEGQVYNYRSTTIRDETGQVTRYDGYKTDIYAQLAVDTRDDLGTQQPWVFWLAPNAPHVGRPRDSDDSAELQSCSPSPTWRDTEQSTPLPADPAFNEADVSDKPFNIRQLSPL
jgi:arylsulfatase A-like enzyme